ncbi:MAG: XRE family transcriptional regulator [Bryobacteraceae bacterium]
MRGTETSEDTIRRVLSAYDIGGRLRRVRLKRKIGLVQLGRAAELSPSMLSQIETGKLFPTVLTLARIASALNLRPDYFFTTHSPPFQVTRAGDLIQFPDSCESGSPSYYFQVLAYGTSDKTFSSYFAEFPRRESTARRPHQHDASEFLYMVDGALEITFEGGAHVLNTGDAVFFDGRGSHSYRGLSDLPARALVITTPMRF